MSRLIDRVRHYAATHSLWTASTRVFAAVSGGADSVALLFVLRELAERGECTLAGLAHLNHHIRGEAAGGDTRFCRDLAARIGVPALIGDADVPALAAQHGVSLEVAGRNARQAFYLEAQATLGADRVAVAHTRDDQAETVLLRLVRGAGPTGLSGIAPRRDHLVRPLLEIPRSDLRAYLAAIGEAWREDETNADRAIPRNRIRHDVLPQLRELNAQVDAALSRTADILRVDAAFLDALANEASARLVKTEEHTEYAGDQAIRPSVRIEAGELAKLPPALARRVALRALETANPSRSYGLEEAQALCELAAGGSGANFQGLDMERSGADVVLVNRRCLECLRGLGCLRCSPKGSNSSYQCPAVLMRPTDGGR